MRSRQFDKAYMRMAEVFSSLSRCERKKVGCIVIKGKQIISDGFNGSPAGFPNRCECEEGKTLESTLHAEANAISKLAKSTLSSEGATLYTTLSPCMECSKLIIQAGIIRVVYMKEYKCNKGLELLKRAKIEVEQIKSKV